jgi:hypothetical protein
VADWLGSWQRAVKLKVCLLEGGGQARLQRERAALERVRAVPGAEALVVQVGGRRRGMVVVVVVVVMMMVMMVVMMITMIVMMVMMMMMVWWWWRW